MLSRALFTNPIHLNVKRATRSLVQMRWLRHKAASPTIRQLAEISFADEWLAIYRSLNGCCRFAQANYRLRERT